MNVINRKTLVFSTTMDATGKFERVVSLPFSPDEVIVKQVAYNSVAVEPAFSIYSEIVGDTMFIVSNPCNTNLDNRFNLKSFSTPNTYSFKAHVANPIVNQNNMAITHTGQLLFTLEFNEFQKEKK